MKKSNKNKKPSKVEKHKSLNSVVRFILTRNIVLIFGAFVFVWLLTDVSKVNIGEKIRLNKFSQPEEFHYLTRFMNGEESFRKDKFAVYQYYYEQALGRIPEKGAVKTLLGYCHFVLSDYNLSAQYFNEALGNNPEIFWPFYDLGIMSYRSKKYDQAIRILKEAVGRNPFDTIRFFQKSEKIYLPIFASARMTEPELLQHLKKGYQESYILLTASFYYLSDFKGMKDASLKAIQAKVEGEALFYFYAGAASYFLKDYSDALKYLKESLVLDENRKATYYYLGLAYKAMGQKKLFEDTKPYWVSLSEEDKNVKFSTEDFKVRLY